MPRKYSKKPSKKRVSKKKRKSKIKTKNVIPKNEVEFMKNLINNDNKPSIPSYTPLNNDNNYTPTMPTTLSAVDTATMPKQQLLGAPNNNMDPLMLNSMAPVNPQVQGIPPMPMSPMQGMEMNAPPMPGMEMNAPSMPGMPMNAPPMPGMPMNAPPMPGMQMNAPPMPGMQMNAPPIPGMPMSPMQGMPMNAPPMPGMPMNAPPMQGMPMGMPPMQGGKIPDYTKCELIPSYTN